MSRHVPRYVPGPLGRGDNQGDSILTGEETRLAKMKPPIYGHSSLTYDMCLLEITEWWRYIALLSAWRATAHYALNLHPKCAFWE